MRAHKRIKGCQFLKFKPGANYLILKYYLIVALLSPVKYIVCFQAVFRVFAIVKIALDNLLKGEISKQMTGS